MTIRRILIILPTLVIIILLQSYLWVPTYEQQTKGNPERLVEYINGSSGDASILNPILSSDSTSSTIESMVFEGLIDRDENLRYRGRLATSWEIYEEAYFYINKTAAVPGIGPASPQQIADMLRSAKEKKSALPEGLQATLESIRDITLIPPRKYDVVKSVSDPSDKKKKINVTLHVSAPSRVKFTLNRVDQDLFENLGHILGKKYFTSFPSSDFVTAKTPLDRDRISALSQQILPASEHNPVLVFQLRPDVKFQDGHTFDAEDVKFTYESIMNPKNLSPRIADYVPVKSVVVMDPHTVKITYKRLYSPAIGTWGMGILPEHLLNAESLKKEAIRLKKDPEKY